ncbi:transporter substrate-binding domain-containing protein [Aurantimonas sp. VKM B-3413]|uniref:transporter substrate-binding domain-containing protein n=1 Tax=Aurantimonas sp. VKM B-3413 TaxID=2779401 RepID=UPI001E2F6817|nr:transporter substrate-binding domain-containing protein [Aurantimonas sp. VKM B-3413]MCB8840127.1 transporter substrate-binding domain-containing protein [Aurantimonas sp. VKM B-3413]
MRERIALKLLLIGAVAFCSVSVLLLGQAARAQQSIVPTPNFFDQRQRMTKPDLSGRQRIRFLTTTDYPPFNFLDARGRLTGFNVELARGICEELDILARCQIEAMAFKDLVPALKRGDGEAIIAGLAMTPATRADFAFSEPYFRYPARFVARKDHAIAAPIADHLKNKVVGVEKGSSHSAMLQAFFPDAQVQPFESRDEGLSAMKEGKIDAFFGDGVSLSFWLESEAAADCCAFSGGPFLSDRFLGEGLAVAVAPNDTALADSIDYAIGQMVEKKRFSDLMLRYFPVSAF